MDDERTRAGKLAQVDLHILARLYEAEPNFVAHLTATDVLEPAIKGVTVEDVIARMRHLGSEDEVHGTPTDTGLGMAQLRPLMRQRLEDPAPTMSGREDENWIERIRWILSEPRKAGDLIGARDAVLERPNKAHSAFGPR